MHKVSVIVPVYNTSRYLKRCLDSIHSQTLEDIEVIIVNDGSTDDSDALCKQYIRDNKLGWKLYTKPNGGLSSSRHYGWERSSGEYIVFVDSDDDLHRDYCKYLYEAIQSTGSQLAICGYNLCDGISKKVNLPDYDTSVIEDVIKGYSKRLILATDKECLIPGFLWMRMMKRDLITEDCFVNENIVFAEDQVFDLEYSQNVNKIAVVPKPLYNYYINPGSLTLKYRPNMLDMAMKLNKIYFDFLESHNLLDDGNIVDIQKNKVDSIIASIVNHLRFGSFSQTMDLMKKISKSREYQEPFELLNSSSHLSQFQRIWWFFIKARMVLLPFIYYKLRFHI